MADKDGNVRNKKMIRTIRVDDRLWRLYRKYSVERKKSVSALLREHIIKDLVKDGKIKEDDNEGGLLE